MQAGFQRLPPHNETPPALGEHVDGTQKRFSPTAQFRVQEGLEDFRQPRLFSWAIGRTNRGYRQIELRLLLWIGQLLDRHVNPFRE
jgi:hypothetical protein